VRRFGGGYYLELRHELALQAAENKHDPRNHMKHHETNISIRVTSCDFLDRFAASLAADPFFSTC